MSSSGQGSARKFSACVGIRIPKEVAQDTNCPFTFDGQKVWVVLDKDSDGYFFRITPYNSR